MPHAATDRSVASLLASAAPDVTPMQSAASAPAAPSLMHAAAAYGKPAIERVMTGLLAGAYFGAERRRHARVSFVRTAWLSFAPPRSAGELSGGDRGEFEMEIEVITTDISREGIGILTWYGFGDALPRLAFLQVEGSLIECEVRWREQVACLVHRYGLQIRDILDNSPRIG